MDRKGEEGKWEENGGSKGEERIVEEKEGIKREGEEGEAGRRLTWITA